MGIDVVDLLRPHARVHQRIVDRPGDLPPPGLHHHEVVSVGGLGEAGDLGQDWRTPSLGTLQLFEDQHRAAPLAEKESRTIAVEGAVGPLRIFTAHQSPGEVEAVEDAAVGIVEQLHPAGQHEVRLPGGDGAVAMAQSHGARGAGGAVGTMRTDDRELDAQRAGRRVRHGHGHRERIVPRRRLQPLLHLIETIPEEVPHLAQRRLGPGEGVMQKVAQQRADAADARAERDAGPLGLEAGEREGVALLVPHLPRDARRLQRLEGRGHGDQGRTVVLQPLDTADSVRAIVGLGEGRPEAGGELGVGEPERRDGLHPGRSRQAGAPEVFDPVADRADDPEAGDGDPAPHEVCCAARLRMKSTVSPTVVIWRAPWSSIERSNSSSSAMSSDRLSKESRWRSSLYRLSRVTLSSEVFSTSATTRRTR